MDHLAEMIRSECIRTCGCTDPGCVALAASRAAAELRTAAENITVAVSPNLYKNGAWVCIPNTEECGLELAAALGALIPQYQDGLAVLEHVEEENLRRARAMVQSGAVTVQCRDTPDLLYVEAQLAAGEDRCRVVIRGDYTHITLVEKNGVTLEQNETKTQASAGLSTAGETLSSLYEKVMQADWHSLEYLQEYARINLRAAEAGMASERMQLSRCLQKQSGDTMADRCQLYVAAAAEARMQGLNVPIVAITGSGNHGIVNFAGTAAAARFLGADAEHTVRALALSSAVTIYIKDYLQRMTAFCGCSVAASTGVAAAVTYLLGGTYEQSVLAMQSVTGTLSGMLCDGAKISCAYKAGIAVRMAVQAAQLAMEGCGIPAPVGILGPDIDQTIRNMARINNPGMLQTEKEIVSIIRHNKEVSRQPQ